MKMKEIKVQNCIRQYDEKDIEDIVNIFNFFARTSYAVYNDCELDVEHIRKMLEQAKVTLILHYKKKVIGYGYISPYKPFRNFDATGVLTYFILQEYTGKGLGTKLFNELIAEGKKKGITNYLAHISSKNIQSLNFHKKMGFKKVGRFKDVAVKFGELIDIIWVQKKIN